MYALQLFMLQHRIIHAFIGFTNGIVEFLFKCLHKSASYFHTFNISSVCFAIEKNTLLLHVIFPGPIPQQFGGPRDF